MTSARLPLPLLAAVSWRAGRVRCAGDMGCGWPPSGCRGMGLGPSVEGANCTGVEPGPITRTLTMSGREKVLR